MRVLVVKLSSLGDVVHSLPAVMDMKSAVPGISIDWVVEPAFAGVLKLCPAVDRVIPCNLRHWRKQWWTQATRLAWAAFRQDLQICNYDAVIDLQGLTKSALVARMARLSPQGQRYAMANRTAGSGYEAPTRWVADVLLPCAWQSHAVDRGRSVCAQALSYSLPPTIQTGLVCMPQATGMNHTVALLHGSSRRDKNWPLAHWQSLGQELQQQGFGLALPHANDDELQTAQAIAAVCPLAQVWPRSDLVELSQRLVSCAGAIGVDSGVSHIATALGLPHVQIYNFDTAWRTGPLHQAQQMAVFDTPTPSVAKVMLAWSRCWQAHLQQTT